jgi:hypothetical protein
VGLLDTVETALVVAERSGRIVLMNTRVRKLLDLGVSAEAGINLFTELLKVDAKEISREIESGNHEVRLQVERGGEKLFASVRWMPEPDWVVVQFQRQQDMQQAPDRAIPQPPCGVFEVAGSEPAKNGVPGFRGARVEDAAGSDQGLLRSNAGGFAGNIV